MLFTKRAQQKFCSNRNFLQTKVLVINESDPTTMLNHDGVSLAQINGLPQNRVMNKYRTRFNEAFLQVTDHLLVASSNDDPGRHPTVVFSGEQVSYLSTVVISAVED